ncbi:TPA: MBL fold metallo-hydrolase [Klebsiella michiganensis]|nr:MBL fold metallo-hydrolase [Klebsiella michiganensis]
MNVTLIRNATLTLDFAGQKFLIDPMLAKKGSYPGFEGTPNSHLRNPLVELPVDVSSLLDSDAVIVTHLHPDHWDDAAVSLIPKNKPIFVQNEEDADVIRLSGFSNVQVLENETHFEGVTLYKTSGQHGSDDAYAVPELAELLGEVCGVVFSHPTEKSAYLAGDTLWNKYVTDALNTFTPDIVILNNGFAQVPPFGAIIMGKEDVKKVHEVLPEATIISVHLEAVNHCVLTRDELRSFISEHNLDKFALVPRDGEVISL